MNKNRERRSAVFRSHTPHGFVLGLGVPVAMAIIALWQWQRVGALPTVPVTSLRYYGQRSRGCMTRWRCWRPDAVAGRPGDRVLLRGAGGDPPRHGAGHAVARRTDAGLRERPPLAAEVHAVADRAGVRRTDHPAEFRSHPHPEPAGRVGRRRQAGRVPRHGRAGAGLVRLQDAVWRAAPVRSPGRARAYPAHGPVAVAASGAAPVGSSCAGSPSGRTRAHPTRSSSA